MADYKPQPRKKTALDDIKWRLKADRPLDGAKFPPTLSFVQQTNGNPMLEIYLNNNEKDINKLRIQVKMDPWMADIIFETLTEALRSKDDNFKRVLEVKANFLYGKRLDTPKVVSKVIVGKNDQGRVYLGVAAEGRPSVRFNFEANTDWFAYADGNGNPLPTVDNDRIFTAAWIAGVRSIWHQLFMQNWKAPEPKERPQGGYDNNRGNGNGNSGNSGYSGGNNNSQVSDADLDDLW